MRLGLLLGHTARSSDFKGAHGATGKACEARYAHIWTVSDGRITTFRQYIDTLAIAQACV